MNIFIKELFKNINPKRKGFKKKILSFTFFLILSTAFWFLNILGENYSENISYPINYINLPKDKEVTSNLPTEFKLKVSTSGYNLLQFYLNTNIKPILIDYNKANIKISGDYKYLLTKDYSEKIASHLSKVEIIQLSPDSIKFKFQQIIKKKVPIQALATYKITEGFTNNGEMYTKPDSVEVSGAKNIIDLISEVYTGVIDVGEIKETAKRNVAIKKIEGVKYKSYRTDVYIPIEQSTERIINLPIQVNSNTEGTNIKLIPNTIMLSYKVGLSQYTAISNDQFVATVSYSDSSKDQQVLKVELSEFPSNVYEIEFTPNFVEFLIEQND